MMPDFLVNIGHAAVLSAAPELPVERRTAIAKALLQAIDPFIEKVRPIESVRVAEIARLLARADNLRERVRRLRTDPLAEYGPVL